ncbi:hypothetical protein PAMC26577_19660 [Caballeronia sordidicola]|uniref:Uncharacterized protein n=1 Tax=Caballeronia sordidicola TaxID=196367 RepID=A0A242MNQ0_CABSO|nr:hypothetical protein PAMC26577_19660 [Caballeronia sordidicola]
MDFDGWLFESVHGKSMTAGEPSPEHVQKEAGMSRLKST